MQCQDSRDWLFHCDDPRPEHWDSEQVAAHLGECEGCRELAARLAALEESWRSLPMPAGMETSRAAFLARLPELTAESAGEFTSRAAASSTAPARGASPSKLPAPSKQAAPKRVSTDTRFSADKRTLPVRPDSRVRHSWRSMARLATAAALLIGAGVGLWTTLNVSESQAATRYFDQLIDLNLQLTAADSPSDRQRTYDQRAPELQAALDRHALDPEDREMARFLLATSAVLAVNDDPIEQAEQFNQIADKLVKQIKTAARRGNHSKLDRQARHYSLVAEGGVKGNLKKATAGNLTGKRRHKYEHIKQGDIERRRVLNALVKDSPKSAAKEIHRAFRQAEKATKTKSSPVLEPDAPFENVLPSL